MATWEALLTATDSEEELSKSSESGTRELRWALAFSRSDILKHEIERAEETTDAASWVLPTIEEVLERIQSLCASVVLIDVESVGIEAIELLEAFEALGYRPTIICSCHGPRSVSPLGDRLIFVDRDEAPSALAQHSEHPAAPAKPMSTTDYIDLCRAGRLSAEMRFAFPANAEVTLYRGEIVRSFSGEFEGLPALLSILEKTPQAVSPRILDLPPVDRNVDDYAANIAIKERNRHVASANLEKLGELDGFLGTCLVDTESGMVLGTHGGDGINLEVAASGNTEVVKAKGRTMNALQLDDDIEDILITLGKQYHLIRPSTKSQGLFFYLALDRKKANLAMARHALKSFEGTFEL